MRSKVEKKPETKKTDYYFLLKCMAGLTAAALVTAGVLAVVAAKTSTTAGAAGLLAASTAAAGPIGALAAIVGIAAILAAACILPCLFGVGGSSVTYASARPYRPWWQPTPFLAATTTVPVYSAPVHTYGGSIFGSSRLHNHGGSVFGNSAPVHTHSSSVFSGSSNSHNHSHSHGTSTAHEHSGPTVHRH